MKITIRYLPDVKLLREKNPSVGEDVKQLDPSSRASESVTGSTLLEDYLAVSTKTDHTYTLTSSNFNTRYIPGYNVYTRAPEHLESICIAVSLTELRTRSNPNESQWQNG